MQPAWGDSLRGAIASSPRKPRNVEKASKSKSPREYACVKRAERVYTVAVTPDINDLAKRLNKQRLIRPVEETDEFLQVRIKRSDVKSPVRKPRKPSPKKRVASVASVHISDDMSSLHAPWHALRDAYRGLLGCMTRVREVSDVGLEVEANLKKEVAHAVAAVVTTAQLVFPRNRAVECQARVAAAEAYATVGLWSDAQRHATIALKDIVACETSPEAGVAAPLDLASTLASGSERPDPARSTYRRVRGDSKTMPPRKSNALNESGCLPPDVLGVTMEDVLKLSSTGKWSDAGDADTVTLPRELADLGMSTPQLKDTQFRLSLQSPEPIVPGKADVMPPDASQMGPGGRAAMLETYEGFGSFYRSFCSALRRQNRAVLSTRGSVNAIDSFTSDTDSIDTAEGILYGDSPSASHAVQIQYWIRRLFSETYSSNSPWQWLTAVCSRYCVSLGALCEYPPTKTPKPRHPHSLLTWRDVVRCLRAHKPSTSGGLDGSKPSHSRMAYCDEPCGDQVPLAGKFWSFNDSLLASYQSGGVFSDMVEEFIAGTDPEVAAATANLLEKLCNKEGFTTVPALLQAALHCDEFAKCVLMDKFLDLLEERSALSELSVGTEAAKNSDIGSTGVIGWEEVLCIVTASRLIPAQWWDTLRARALTAMGCCAVQDKRIQVATTCFKVADECHVRAETQFHLSTLPLYFAQAELAQAHAAGAVSGEVDEAARLSLTSRFHDIELGMRKLASYVTQHNLGRRSLTVAKHCNLRAQALLRRGDIAKAKEVVNQALEVVLGNERQQLQPQFAPTVAVSDAINCTSLQSMLSSAYGAMVSATTSSHVRQLLTGHLVLSPPQHLPVSSIVSVHTFHTLADVILTAPDASSDDLLCCVDLLEASRDAVTKLCDTIRSTYSFVPIVAQGETESRLRAEAASCGALCVTALLRLGQTMGANAVLSHDSLDVAGIRTSMLVLKHCERLVHTLADSSHTVDHVLSDGHRWLSLCDAYELVAKAVLAGQPKRGPETEACVVYCGWNWQLTASGRQTPVNSLQSTSVPVSEVSQPITDDGRGDTMAIVTPRETIEFFHASPCEAVLPIIISAKLCASEAKSCVSSATELVLAHTGLGNGLAGLRASKPSALSAVRSARASRATVRTQNDACNSLRTSVSSRVKALRRLQQVVMAAECRDVFGEDIDGENSDASESCASLDVGDVQMVL